MKQYSVYEAMLNRGELRKMVSQVADCCDPSTDRLAVWWPVDGIRWIWHKHDLQADSQAVGAYQLARPAPHAAPQWAK